MRQARAAAKEPRPSRKRRRKFSYPARVFRAAIRLDVAARRGMMATVARGGISRL